MVVEMMLVVVQAVAVTVTRGLVVVVIVVLAQVADVIVVLVLVVDVVVEAVDKQEMAVKVNNFCIITVDLTSPPIIRPFFPLALITPLATTLL